MSRENNIRKRHLLVIFSVYLFLLTLPNYSFSQALLNNGGNVTALQGSFIYVNGSVVNQSGGEIVVDAVAMDNAEMYVTGDITNNATISDDGHIRLLGNWFDNGVFIGGTGTVFLEGGAQILGGTSETVFNNLTLDGSGLKTQTIDKSALGILDLKHLELQTETHTFFMLNSDSDAIIRTTGFVSSLNGGKLSRMTNSTNNYLFPVGSSLGILRYRPVVISPDNNSPNTYTVRLANLDSGLEGYDRNDKSTEICLLNPMFYHQINRSVGLSSADINIYFDESSDGEWEGISNWKVLPSQWEVVPGSTILSGMPLSIATKLNWNDFSSEPYILHKSTIVVSFDPLGQYCVGETPDVLPAISNEGIPGTWFPATINTDVAGVVTYLFTPDLGFACATTFEMSIDVIDCCNMVLNVGVTDSQCFGGDGSIQFNVSGGTSPMVSTINGIPAVSPYAAPAGTYTIEVVDALNCLVDTTVIISQPDDIDVTLIGQDVSCFGYADGVASVDLVTGGTYPYFYEWNTGQTSSVINGIAAGDYDVIVYDMYDCTGYASITIAQPGILNVTLSSVPAQCGGNGGSVVATVSGGTGTADYLWSNLQTGYIITNVAPGQYFVSVTDDNGCSVTNSTIVNHTGSIIASISVLQEISCNQDNNGVLQAVNANGVLPVSYLWNNDATSTIISDLSAGTYSVVITDAWGCIGNSFTTLANPQPIVINGVVTDVSCYDGNDGAISTIASGGDAPYNYNWNNLFFDSEILGLIAGDYTVTVSDGGGCFAIETFTVDQPTQLELNEIVHQISCFGYVDGAVLMSATGGVSDYQFMISNENQTVIGPSHTGLPQGFYILSVEDSNGCKDSTEIVISEPSFLSATYSQTNPSCVGMNDGSIELIVVGGVAPYLFEWGGNVIDIPLISSLYEGSYIITVADTNGCEYTLNQIILTDTDVDCLTIPNAFTPNSDGTNDTWIIENLEYFPGAYYYVYNRWGQLLYTGRPGDNWNGTYNNKFVPPATYLYVIELYNGIDKPYLGTVTVIY